MSVITCILSPTTGVCACPHPPLFLNRDLFPPGICAPFASQSASGYETGGLFYCGLHRSTDRWGEDIQENLLPTVQVTRSKELGACFPIVFHRFFGVEFANKLRRLVGSIVRCQWRMPSWLCRHDITPEVV